MRLSGDFETVFMYSHAMCLHLNSLSYVNGEIHLSKKCNIIILFICFKLEVGRHLCLACCLDSFSSLVLLKLMLL